jgi:hypothetical protein
MRAKKSSSISKNHASLKWIMPQKSKSDVKAAFLVFFLALVPLAILAHKCVFIAGNDASRFAQIESLVDYGEPFIDHSRYNWTVDKIRIEGHDYSNKPPLLALIGAAFYLILKSVFGWTFANNEAMVVRSLIFILVCIPSAWLISQFHLALRSYPKIPIKIRLLSTVALAAGTILLSFSVTLNNHTISAAFLFAAICAAWRGHGFYAGAFSGFGVCIDVVPGLCLIPVIVWIIFDTKKIRGVIRCSIALLGSAFLFFGANLLTLGSLLLPKLVPGGVDYSSQFSKSFGGVLLPETWHYPFECLLGGHGFLSVSPVLIFGILGLYFACRRPIVLRPLWCKILAVYMGIQIFGHIILVGSYGGWSYGFRYLIPIIPLLMFFAPAALSSWRTVVFTAVLAVSILFALLGAYHPWPPAYEQEANKDPIAAMVTNPVGGNAAAWLEKYYPDSDLAQVVGSLFIHPEPELRRKYFIYFFKSKCDRDQIDRYRQLLQQRRN